MDKPSKSTETGLNRVSRKGIYLLPNLFTTAGIFAGFYAIVAAMKGIYDTAAIAIFVAMIMDSLDGRVARLTNTQTDFGVQYDSLADIVSFGIAPALVAYSWILHDLGKTGWLAAFLYTAAGALRLARFNTQAASHDKRFFQGLPIPAAAAVIAGLVWLGSQLFEPSGLFAFAVAFITVALGLLMVSNVRYYSFKDIDFKGKVPFIAIFAVVLIFIGVTIDPPTVLFTGFFIYALSGPIYTLWALRRRRPKKV